MEEIINLEYKSNMDSLGRILIPSKVRKLLDLKQGDEVTLRYNNGALVLITPKESLKQLRYLLKKGKATKNHTQEFINLRKEDNL